MTGTNRKALVFVLLSPWLSSGFSTTRPIRTFGVSSSEEYGEKRRTSRRPQTSLHNVIRGIEEQDLIDEGLGGVTLSIESAILVSGKYDRKSDEFSLSEIARYSELTEITDVSTLQSYGTKVIGKGQGVECYHNPGEGTTKQVDFAPIVAAKKAIDSISIPFGDISTLSINVLGGEELIINEAVDGALQVVRNLDIPSKCAVVMTSLCHSIIPATSASVTVVAESGNGQGETGFEKGYIYQFEGKLWTLSDDNLRTEVS